LGDAQGHAAALLWISHIVGQFRLVLNNRAGRLLSSLVAAVQAVCGKMLAAGILTVTDHAVNVALLQSG